MNYYIQGDAAKADQIKAAFKAKGISDGGNSFIHSNYLYFSEGGEVDFCGIGGHVANIIKTHPNYKELELPIEPKFKVGNWYLCVKDVYGRGVRFDKGNAYHCGKDGCLQQVDSGAHISIVEELYEYFRPWTIADAKDGDVLATDNGLTCIFKAFDGCVFSSYCFMDFQKWFYEVGSEAHTLDSRINGNIHPATKEQRGMLFKKMKEAGYEWDKNKKELRKIQPHYDIANFRVGMPVLVRDGYGEEWNYLLFSHYRKKVTDHFFAGGNPWFQCIPFNEETEHLLGTTDPCGEEYINW